MRMTNGRVWMRNDEAELLNCAVRWLSPRKLRLFVVECCRQVGDLIPEGPCRLAVEAAEGFADGHVSAKKLALAHRDARAYYKILNDLQRARQVADASYWAGIGCKYVAAPDPHFRDKAAIRAAEYACLAAYRALSAAYDRDSDAFVATPSCEPLPLEHTPIHVIAERARQGVHFGVDSHEQAAFTVELAQAEVLIDMLAHPTLPCRIDPAWLTWNNGAVGKLAQAFYQERNWFSLPILADALEEAGCTSAELTAHLRELRRHVRGCWALDLLLGRN